MPGSLKSVLIVDDHAYVRGGLRMFIEHTEEMFVCGEAANGIEAIEMAKDRKPDVILMDLSMPGGLNGAETAASIRKLLPKSRIVVFTLFYDGLGKLLAKAVGVDLVISKTEGIGGLTRALEQLLADSSSENDSVRAIN